ncbi:MAG: acylphosphatase, partial [bacterium]
EVFAEGPRDQLERLIEILNQGPRFGEVDKVEVEWHDYKGRYDTFFIETGY